MNLTVDKDVNNNTSDMEIQKKRESSLYTIFFVHVYVFCSTFFMTFGCVATNERF